MSEVINVEVRTKENVIAEIRATWDQINRTALDGAIRIGIGLKELKELVPHGEWGNYIEENLPFSQRKVNRFMEIAESYGDEKSSYFRIISNSSTLTNLSVSKALQLLALPEEDVEDFVSETPIDDLTTKELEDKIKEITSQNQDLEGEVKKLSKELAAAVEKKSDMESEEATGEDLASKQAEIDKLTAEIAKKEKKIQALQNKADKADEEMQKQIAVAEDKVKADAEAAAKEKFEKQIENLTSEKEAEAARAAAAVKKLELSSNEDILIFKIRVDEMQDAFNAAVDVVINVRETNPEQAEKMSKALVKILGPMQGAAENYNVLQA